MVQHKSFQDMTCPIARSLEHVGEWWSMLILRDAFAGLTRFDEFRQSLGIAPNMLTRRLSSLVEAGMLRRHQYSDKPPRDEFLLTERAEDFRNVLVALFEFGNKHFKDESTRMAIVDRETEARVIPVFADVVSGRRLDTKTHRFAHYTQRGSARDQSVAMRYQNLLPDF
jgi:DNA-binding HxlR family transcriptional regulator